MVAVPNLILDKTLIYFILFLIPTPSVTFNIGMAAALSFKSHILKSNLILGWFWVVVL